MSAREELAEMLMELAGLVPEFDRLTARGKARWLARTDALLASPALARVIREREFEAIKAANLRAIRHEIETPSRDHGGCCGDQTEEHG